MVEVVVKPCFERTANEAFADGVVLDTGTKEHDHAGEYGSEAHSHLVEDNSCKDEKEDKHVEKRLGALHGTESRGVPAAFGEHQILDGREDVDEDVGTEHGQCQKQQGRPSECGRVSKCFLNLLSHRLMFCSYCFSQRSSQLKYVRCQRMPFCGLSTQ